MCEIKTIISVFSFGFVNTLLRLIIIISVKIVRRKYIWFNFSTGSLFHRIFSRKRSRKDLTDNSSQNSNDLDEKRVVQAAPLRYYHFYCVFAL